MATNTTHYNLAKPAYTEPADIGVINGDMDLIDSALHDHDTALDKVENSIAIVATGNTHAAISSGQYVYVKEHTALADGLYTASTNIAANATLSSSNLTAVSGGGMNALKASVDTLNSNLTAIGGDFSITSANSSVTINAQRCEKLKGASNVKFVWVMFTLSASVGSALFSDFQNVAVNNCIVPVYKVSATETAVYSMRIGTNGVANANGDIPAGQYVAMGLYA